MRAAIVFGAALLACGSTTLPPRGQLVLHVDTDAPLPSVGPSDERTDPLVLFDRLRVEIVAPGETAPCSSCRNDFGIDTQTFAGKRASVGVVLPPGVAGYKAHVTLYLARLTDQVGDPLPLGDGLGHVSIEQWIALPKTAETGVIDVSMFLPTDQAGQLADPDAPIAPAPGAPSESRVGSWPAAARTPCATNDSSKTACVRGGTFWFGALADDAVSGRPTNFHRLVTISPFRVDPTEVTAGTFRANGGTALVQPGSYRKTNTGTVGDWCTLTEQPTSDAQEAMALNCIKWSAARSYCQARGGDLPTDAQSVYLATRFGTSKFVWGEDEPSCEDAVWSRGGAGPFALASSKCRTELNLPATVGPEPPGTGTRDRLTLDGVDVVDIAGNLSEMLRDRLVGVGDPCYAGPIVTDPTCSTPTGTDSYSLRKGNWVAVSFGLRGTGIYQNGLDQFGPERGFRCVYPGH